MKIYIQGFKSIRDGQFVAIGDRLTFLVGPNSAGKSVVLSALEKLSGERSQFELDMNLIHKNPVKDSAISACHSLGIEWQYGRTTYGMFDTYFTNEVLENADAQTLKKIHASELTGNWGTIQENMDWGYALNRRSSIYIDGLLSAGVSKLGYRNTSLFGLWRRRTKINIDQIYFDLAGIIDKDIESFKEYARWEIETIENAMANLANRDVVGMYSQKHNSELLSSYEKIVLKLRRDYQENLFCWDFVVTKSAVEEGFSGLEKQRLLNILERYDAKIQKYKNELIKQTEERYPGRYFLPSLVSGERGLPSESDINCHLKLDDSEDENSKNIYHDLMWSKAYQEWFVSVDQPLGRSPSLFDCVNKALSDNLFTDNGYQLQVSARALINKRLWDDRRDHGEDIDTEEREFLCQLSLVDSHKRKLTFNDVGSGIGYVLPVLIAAFREANKGRIVFLQQPELHLHPALQTNLTDVLIEASADKRIVAETHSEHMILRALKRIRQTTNGTIQDPALQLKPQDVSVNYFETLPDGSTKVHILRISKDGDFLDRWPNGFFEERGQELFDE